MPAPSAFDWALIRVVPRVERGEQLNAGVIVHSATADLLAARVVCDRARIAALFPGIAAADLDAIEQHLASIPAVCRGGPGAGPIGALARGERFHWLVAPRSTVVQTSAVHAGLAADVPAALDELFRRYVAIS